MVQGINHQRDVFACLLYTSLDEVFSVADTITIFRNGEKIGDFKSEDLDKKSLSYYMTGREVEYPRYHRTSKEDTPILAIENLTRKNQYENKMCIRDSRRAGRAVEH